MTSRELQNQAFIDQVADALCLRGWRLPALTVLEAGRPLAFLGGQLLWLLQPVAGPLVSREFVGATARLLEEPSGVDALIRRLEAGEK